MPEAVSAGVDFLSGDYSMLDSVNCARLEARCLAPQGKPWDLMAWGFAGTQQLYSTKTVVQLQQEAAVVLALGGGFQVYFTQERDGYVRQWPLEVMGEVAKFCRARQAVCHRATTVPQIGLLYSTAAFYRKVQNLFVPWNGELTPLTGILNALLDNQQSVDVVMEHQLAGRMSDYPLLVIPEWEYLAPAFVDALRAYVRGGGRLLLLGPRAAALFAKELDIVLNGQPVEARKWVAHRDRLGATIGLFQEATLGATARPFGALHERDDFNSPKAPAAVVTPCGRGVIAAVLINLGERYRKARNSVVRDFLGAVAGRLFPHPLVTVGGSHFVDVVVTRSHGNLTVNLVNTAGPHHDPGVHVYDEVPPIGPLSIRIRTNGRPARIVRHPGGEPLPFTYAAGAVRLTLPRLEIHEVLVIEEKARSLPHGRASSRKRTRPVSRS
jgi:hypothetical protein